MHIWTHRSLLLFLLSPGTITQANAAPAPLFAGDEIVEITIRAPLTALFRERDKTNHVDGAVEYVGDDGNKAILAIGLSTRGNYRNDPRNCRFPPLFLDFKKKKVAETLFAEQDKLKLVTHCKNSRSYEESVIREYLAYRVFNLLSDLSFRVRLLRVTYIDITRNNKEAVHFGFLIEHRKSFAKRTGIPVAHIRSIKVAQLQPAFTNLTSLYHLFIGNTDFSQIAPEPDDDCCHNHALFARSDEAFFSVPYDFDMSGFVKAPHSVPTGKSRLQHVRQRRYRGWCEFNDRLPENIALFRARRNDIVALVESNDLQRTSPKKSLLGFIDKFYDIVEDPDRVEKKLIEDCKSTAKKKS